MGGYYMICCHKEYKNIIFTHLTLPRDPNLCMTENVKCPNLKKYNFQVRKVVLNCH